MRRTQLKPCRSKKIRRTKMPVSPHVNFIKKSPDTFEGAHPGRNPSSPVVWPADRHQSNQIQQTKGSAKPQASFVLPTTQPNQSSVQPRTTPAPVSKVRVVLRPSPGQKVVTVQFNHPSGDPYFSGANVYLQRARQQPVLVASGAKSPLNFTVSTNNAPHSIFVTSVGNWGETNILTSPSVPVRLS
jgi:proteasome lid subunit RPN8/RPN11